MLREWTYTASSRNALANTSPSARGPRPSRFPSGRDFAPLGPRDCPRASPSGNLSGLGVQNPRPWEISWASGGVFSDTSLLSAVYGFIIELTRKHLTDYTFPTYPSEILLWCEVYASAKQCFYDRSSLKSCEGYVIVSVL